MRVIEIIPLGTEDIRSFHEVTILPQKVPIIHHTRERRRGINDKRTTSTTGGDQIHCKEKI